jgi:hypothetical protein
VKHNRLKLNKWLSSVTALAALVLVLGLVQPQSEIVPSWRVRVVVENGNPVSGALVRESWRNYSIESEGHEEDSMSDDSGYVVFPARYVRSSILKRGVAFVSNLDQGIHASFGTQAYLLAWFGNLDGETHYRRGEPVPETIVLRPKNRQKG